MGSTTIEHLDDLLAYIDGDLDLGLFCGSPQVGGDNHVIQCQERRFLAQRLRGEHIQSCTHNVAALHGIGDGLLVNNFTTGNVGNADALLHRGNGGSVDEFVRLLDGRQVQSDDIRLGENFLLGAHRYSERRTLLGCDERVVGKDGHAERQTILGDLLADVAETHNTQGATFHLNSHERLPVPDAIFQLAVGLGNLPCHRHDHGPGVLSSGDGVALGRIADDNPLVGASGDVDVINTDTCTADDLHLLGGGNNFGGDSSGRANNHGVILSNNLA
mmetsp:Transcript_45379/g.81238  ORF Transcript_45379/g.81238 Transcript_45379/m.81238 type:complete len:274 (+) Transcript_45379:960-1781(+)